MATTSQTPLAEFRHLGQNIFLYKPETDKSETAIRKEEGHSPPSLVIVCTWLGGATAKRINKYTTQYRQLFPHACILLIRTIVLDITVRSFRLIRSRLAPARDAIYSILGDNDLSRESTDGCILLHVFSHGGCNTAIQLAISMRENDMYLPLRQIVFDSCPGDATFRKAYDAATISLPQSQPAHSVGRAALYPAIAVITGLQHLGIMSSVRDMRAELNDSNVFGSHARRLYLYSAADQAVHFQDVQSHLETARAQGYRADGVVFQRSPHVALILEDAVRYWAAIESFWHGWDLSRLRDVDAALPPCSSNP